MPQRRVAEDLREHLDVVEAARCLVYGGPQTIQNDKLGLYLTYAGKMVKEKEAVAGESSQILKQYEIVESPGQTVQQSME